MIAGRNADDRQDRRTSDPLRSIFINPDLPSSIMRTLYPVLGSVTLALPRASPLRSHRARRSRPLCRAMCALHNFILTHDPYDTTIYCWGNHCMTVGTALLYQQPSEGSNTSNDDLGEVLAVGDITEAEKVEAAATQDTIACEM